MERSRFAPVSKKEAAHFNDEQQKLVVHMTSVRSQYMNSYIHSEDRSFTIIAYPCAAIGPDYKEIFTETVKINTLDYALYRDMQQKIIDVLDTADRVHIVGTNGNRTDLYVKIHELKEPSKETAFENCVADVNIPVGEVFTSPVLEGTNGVLHVSRVYLNELQYRDLEITFANGMIADYSCGNFERSWKIRLISGITSCTGMRHCRLESLRSAPIPRLMWRQRSTGSKKRCRS